MAVLRCATRGLVDDISDANVDYSEIVLPVVDGEGEAVVVGCDGAVVAGGRPVFVRIGSPMGLPLLH